MTIRKEFINPDILETKKMTFQQSYLDTAINLITWPIFIANCEKDMEKTDNEDRKKALSDLLNTHVQNQSANEESLETLHVVLDYLNTL